MHEALRKWERESQDSKSVLKSDILEYLAFSWYSQVRIVCKKIAIIVHMLTRSIYIERKLTLFRAKYNQNQNISDADSSIVQK